jgi:hypothetical protein
MFSIMSARRGRLLQAYSDGEHLIIQMTELFSCEDENGPFIDLAFRYLMSEAVGHTSDLSDVTGIKAAVQCGHCGGNHMAVPEDHALIRKVQSNIKLAEGEGLATVKGWTILVGEREEKLGEGC